MTVEALEDRTVPSTFTVHNLADSGPGSLRQAVLDANVNPGTDLIRFAAAVRGTISLRSGELAVTDDLAIHGPGTGRLTVSGNDASRVFRIANRGSAVTDAAISGLTIANGLADQVDLITPIGFPLTAGGGILVAGSRLSLSQVVFRDNEARGFGAGGGAVGGFSDAQIMVTHSTFVGNVATGAFIGFGGGIGVEDFSTLAVAHSRFTDNRATGSQGEVTFLQGVGTGGAAAALGGSRATISHSLFTDNSVRGGGGESGQAGGPALGGAVTATDLGFFRETATERSVLDVHHSTFIGNVAVGGDGGAGARGGFAGGGAVHPSTRTVATVTDSLFVENRSRGGRGGEGGPGSNGGTGGEAFSGALDGIGTSLTVARSLFIGNEAVGGPGGRGGAGADGGAGGVAAGGSIRFLGGFSADPTGIVTGSITSSVFLHNRAVGGVGGRGGAGGDGGRGGDAFGGALDAFLLSDLTLTDGLLRGNTAVGGQGGGQGSGRGGQGGDGFGGALAVSDNTASAALSGSSITQNVARGGAGAPGGTPGRGIGGGVFNRGRINLDRLSLIFANDADQHDDCFGC